MSYSYSIKLGVDQLDKCLKVVEPNSEKLQNKIYGRTWFRVFTEFRNKTRGHGAIPNRKLSDMIPDLESSILLFQKNFSLFQLGWAYIQQTYRKRYRIINLKNNTSYFDALKTRVGESYNFPDEGIYILFENSDYSSLRKVDLAYSDIDISDFYLPNGGFNTKSFEVISYITGNKYSNEDAKNFLAPVEDLPASETQGKLELIQLRSGSISNLPPKQSGYISRYTPEESLYKEIVDDNQHRIITLAGRGGIGKTWLALEVLSKIAEEGHFEAIFWLSARDIDLLSDGAKQVKPHILTQEDIAKEFFRLIGPYFLGYEDYEQEKKNSKYQIEFLTKNMTSCSLGKILFVFDNFETVKSPVELYKWIDTFLRLPNKALITTRTRDFKGDNPVELRGMLARECRQLIDKSVVQLGIYNLLSDEDKNRICEESEGHPYIVKILLGEIKKTGYIQKPERLISQRSDILDSLFERTYSQLSLPSQRVFLTLCSWKSLIAQIALEAVLLRRDIDVEQAVEDLYNSSLIERIPIGENEEVFLSVPLVAMMFGQRKLSINPMQLSIKDDVALLQLFGVTQETDVRDGIMKRIERLFKEITKSIENNKAKLVEYEHILEFIAQKYPWAWIRLSDLYVKIGQPEESVYVLKKYLESSDDTQRVNVLKRLINYYIIHDDPREELFWRLQLSQVIDIDYDIISETANRFNGSKYIWDEGEKNQILYILIRLMEERIYEANATDFSRLGWLYASYGQKQQAVFSAERGLSLDPQNEYCSKLLKSLNGG